MYSASIAIAISMHMKYNIQLSYYFMCNKLPLINWWMVSVGLCNNSKQFIQFCPIFASNCEWGCLHQVNQLIVGTRIVLAMWLQMAPKLWPFHMDALCWHALFRGKYVLSFCKRKRNSWLYHCHAEDHWHHELSGPRYQSSTNEKFKSFFPVKVKWF